MSEDDFASTSRNSGLLCRVLKIDVGKGKQQFLPARRYAARAVLAIIMSVCLSVTSRCSIKTAEPRITKQCHALAQENSKGVTPNGVAKYSNRGWVGSNRRFSTNISLYLKNGAAR